MSAGGVGVLALTEDQVSADVPSKLVSEESAYIPTRVDYRDGIRTDSADDFIRFVHPKVKDHFFVF